MKPERNHTVECTCNLWYWPSWLAQYGRPFIIGRTWQWGIL